MKKIFFHNKDRVLKAVGAMSRREDGPMNYVGHSAYDEDRRVNRHKFLIHERIDSTRMVEPKVMHGNVCEIVDKPTVGFGSLVCDAVVTDKKGLVLTMTAADCPPVFIVDPVSGICGLLHCGWRPVSVGIIENTLERCREAFNVLSGDLWAFIGPGICGRCFEIGPEVASVFGLVTHERTLLNLNEEISKRLVACGMDKTKILLSGECTKCKDDGVKYYSWRRDRSDPLDAQMAVLTLK